MKWINFDDQRPSPNEEVLIHNKSHNFTFVGTIPKKTLSDELNEGGVKTLKGHLFWMPLAEPPNE